MFKSCLCLNTYGLYLAGTILNLLFTNKVGRKKMVIGALVFILIGHIYDPFYYLL